MPRYFFNVYHDRPELDEEGEELPDAQAAWHEATVTAGQIIQDLDGRLREIVIIRVGHLNRCSYVVKQHVPLLALPEGLTQAECDALADWRASPFFDARERAALAFADASTRNVEVPDDVFEALRSHFNERQIVELTVLTGTYNMHTRMCQALKIDPQT